MKQPTCNVRYDAARNEFRVEGGGRVLHLACQAAVHPVGELDTGLDWERLDTTAQDGVTRWRFAARQTCWQRKILTLEIGADELFVSVEVEGAGAIDKLIFFAGFAPRLRPEPRATFRHLRWAKRNWERAWRGSPLSFATVFNPQPNLYQEQVLPATCPQRITCATTFGPETFNTFFAPAPYQYVLDDAFGIGVVAQPGESRFNHFDYLVSDGWGLELAYDGMTRVESRWVSPRLRIGVAQGWEPSLAGYMDSLRRHQLLAPARDSAPAWARRPMVCGWGQQTVWANQAADGTTLPAGSPITPGANGFATQQAYEEFVRLLEEHQLPFGTLTIDCGWSPCYAIPAPDPVGWPDLKGFIARQHARGRKVLLWLATWNPRQLPAEFLMLHEPGLPDVADPTHAGFRDRLAVAIRAAISPAGLDADGFKLDFTGDMPRGPGYRPAASQWGVELLRDYIQLIRDSTKQAKGDAIVETHCAHPLFVELTDVLRLNDIFCMREDVRPAMAFRAKVARLVNPAWVIDTDNDPFISRDAWLDYMRLQPKLGVPSLYSVTHVSFRADGQPLEPIRETDLAEVRAIWKAYEKESLP